jgi:hypothetical protein
VNIFLAGLTADVFFTGKSAEEVRLATIIGRTLLVESGSRTGWQAEAILSDGRCFDANGGWRA